MTEQPLSLTSALRFANHDFVNHLHLIRMNLDLGRVEEAKAVIQDVSENYRLLSNINQLDLPNTSEWLHICRWRFPALQTSLQSKVKHRVVDEIDDMLVQYLEKTVIHVYDHLDPFTEQKLLINIQSDENKFTLKFELNGLWDTQLFQLNEINKFDVQTIEETNTSWIYILNTTQE